MVLPNQNIPEKDKDVTWAAQTCRAIVQLCGNTTNSKLKDKFCYDLMNGIFDEADFNYLRKVDNYEYPAKIRFIPIVRNRLDFLKSQETRRPFSYRVFTADRTSLTTKDDHKMKAILDQIKANYQQKYNAVMTILDQIKMMEEQMSVQQEQNKDPQLALQLVQAKRQLQAMMNPSEKELLLTQKDIEKIDKYYRYDFRDFLEIVSEKGLKFLMQEYNLKKVFSDAFDDVLATDKEYYFTDYRPGDPDPVLRKVNPLNLFYSGDDEVDDVADCEWVMEERWLTIPQIIDEFKDDITWEHMEMFRNRYSYDVSRYRYNFNTYQFGNQQDYQVDSCTVNSNYLYSGSSDAASRIRVCYCYWQTPRQIKFKRSPNKYNDQLEFIHWMTDTDVIKPTDRADVRYVNDVWQGIVIDSDMFIRLRKKDVQLRPVDNYGKVELPYTGPTFNAINKRPYSIVWATKDLQILYNLIHYHEELMLALAGTKGSFMDKSQIPDGMSLQEWNYQKKLGTAWIQTIKEGLQRQPNFNQFQHFDDTLSPAIQYLDQIKRSIEDMVSSITGVTRQALGQIQANDLKATTEASITQSSIVTETIFWKHDHYKRKALEKLINLCKIAWKNGRRGQIVLGDMGQEILNIPEGVFGNADYKVFMADGGKIEKAIGDLQSMAIQSFAKGMFSLSQISKLYSIDTLAEMQITLEEYEELAQKRMEANQQQQASIDERKQQLDLQMKQMMEKQKIALEGVKVELDKSRLDWEKGYKDKELGLKEKEVSGKLENEKMKIATDTNIEQQYINEQKRANNMDFTLQKVQLTLDSLNETLQGLSDNKKSREKIKD